MDENGSLTSPAESDPIMPTPNATEPLGVVVTVDIRLDGMIGKPVFVSWSMWQRGGVATLYGSWLNDNLAFRVDATTNSEVASLDFWIPLPKDPGPYFIRSRAKVAAATMASIDSENFD